MQEIVMFWLSQLYNSVNKESVCEVVVVCWVEEEKSQNVTLHIHNNKRLPHAPSYAHYEYTGNNTMKDW